MINILGEDEIEVVQEEPEKITEEDAKEILEKNKKFFIKLTPEREAELLSWYDTVVVTNFEDEYHLTEEERKKRFEFYELDKEVSRYSNKTRNPVQFVKHMRACLKYLRAVAESQDVYDPDDFCLLFIKDKIRISGLQFPEPKGRALKEFNFDYLMEFIMSDAPATDLVLEPKSEYAELTLEEKAQLLFSPGELERCLSPLSEKESYYDTHAFLEDEDEQDGTNVVVPLSKSGKKKLVKNFDIVDKFFKDIRRRETVEKNIEFSFTDNMMRSDLDELRSYEEQNEFKSPSDHPEFKGDLMNGKDYKKYCEEVKYFNDNRVKELYHGKMRSKREIRDIEVQAFLEESGWNLKNMTSVKQEEEKLRRRRKRDKKRELALKKALTEIQRQNGRKMRDMVSNKDIDKAKKGKTKLKNKMKKKIKNIGKKDKKTFDMRM